MDLVLTRRFAQVALIAVLGLPLQALPAESVPGSPDLIDRQVLVVLDPRTKPPRAIDLARQDHTRDGVTAFIADNDGIDGISKLINFPETEDVASARTTDPLAPAVLLNEYIVVTLREGIDRDRFIEKLRMNKWVLSAERNLRFQYSARFLDPGPVDKPGTYQWAFTSSSPLNFTGAWSTLKGNAYLAAIDNGVYWTGTQTHADLVNGFRPQFSYHLPKPSIPEPPYVPLTGDFSEANSNPIGHGTHVMGLMIADDAGTGSGTFGACPGCSGFVYRIRQIDFSTELVGLAITDAVRIGAQVVNMSLGFQAYGDPILQSGYCSSHPSTLVCTALAYATTRGVSIVAASGNKKAAIDFPANQSSVIAAGGLEKDPATGSVSFFTTGHQNPAAGPCPIPGTGAAPAESGSNCSDSDNVSSNKYQFLAPAKNVLSTFYYGATYNGDVFCGDRYDPYPDGDPLHYNGADKLTTGYGTCTGTSMAAPIISGIIGLIRSANPLLNSADVQAILKRRSSGNGTPISAQYGWGIPSAADAVVAAMSGANASNPNLYDASIVNRTTPLFSAYSSQGKNHFYTSVPQMAAAAILGTLRPAPAYKTNAQPVSRSCTSQAANLCGNVNLNLPAIQVLNPDGSNAGVNAGVRHFVTSGSTTVTSNPGYSLSDSLGVAHPNAVWTSMIPDVSRSATIAFAADTLYPLNYTPKGNLVSNYNLFPGVTGSGLYPRTLINVYVGPNNPTGGAAMVPLYRLSRKCGDFTSPICTPGSSNYNAYHVSHMYATSTSEIASLTAFPNNYKKDGIEGYVFPTSYANAPVSGAVRLCRRIDPVRDEAILFPGTGNNGKKCNPPFPTYATGSYYSSLVGTTDWIGWIIPNYAGNLPPTVSLTSPTNGATFAQGASVSLSATASDSNGVGSVAFYANGTLVSTDNTSPYNKSWTPSAPGTYTLYAVATDNNTAPLQATSDPINITVNSCANSIPSISNAGFEAPALGFGNYDDAPSGASWTFVPVWGGGQSGISANGSAFTSFNPNAPAGVQVGFIQGHDNFIRQTLNFPTCGVFRVRASLAQRAQWNYSYLDLRLFVDGVDYGSLYGTTDPSGLTNYQTFTSAQFYVAAGNRVITLQGWSPDPGQDNSIFIDSVQVVTP